MTEAIILKPSPRFLTKTLVSIVLAGVAVLGGAALISWALSFASNIEASTATTVFVIFAILTAVVAIPALILAAPYYRSLRYEIQPDEVIVRVGIITRSVKHVPYRTVTNITIKRGILDRWLFDLGTLNIQTAGMSGTSGAEESLEGLDNVYEVYDRVVGELRKFRGSMSPTAAAVDILDDSQIYKQAEIAPTLIEILAEVQAIRTAVEES